MTNGQGMEDPAGYATLERFSNAKEFNRWMFDTIAPFCKGHVLEVGSGIGSLSELLLEKQSLQVSLSDLREEYCRILKDRFKNEPRLEDVYQVDLSSPDFEHSYPQLQHRFDTIIALNVVEHIENTAQVLSNSKKMLRPGGRMIVLVPAFQSLYNSFDEELGHFRRYTRKQLRQLFTDNDMKLVSLQYFNAAGIPGWWLYGSVLRKKIIPAKQLTLYNKLVPIFRLLDKISFHAVGLSVIAIADKQD
jgi:SAM-dependent methyltransferase